MLICSMRQFIFDATATMVVSEHLLENRKFKVAFESKALRPFPASLKAFHIKVPYSCVLVLRTHLYASNTQIFVGSSRKSTQKIKSI